MKVIRTALLVLTATSLLAVAVSSATARRLSFSAQPFKIAWSHFELTRATELIECGLTLEGTYHSTVFDKTLGAQFGAITRAAVEACRGSTLVVLTETLPWSLEYVAFFGTLPRINDIALRVVRFSVSWGSIEVCLAASTTTAPLLMDFERNTTTGEVTEVLVERRNKLRLTGITCYGEREAEPIGIGFMSRPETGARFTVRLI